MQQIELEQATKSLGDLIEQAAGGEEIVIARNGRPVARLSAMPPAGKPSMFGCARGLIEIGKDFDAPMPEFEEYTR